MAKYANKQPDKLRAIRVNPYEVPPDQQGWRGIGLHGNHKRKCYTVLQNDQVLVTALITLPGETSARHSHESGELSIHYLDKMNPVITWHPPGEFHGGGQLSTRDSASVITDSKHDQGFIKQGLPDTPEIANLLSKLTQFEAEIQDLRTWVEDQLKPQPSPRLLIDILFPPFKTTIDDPRFPPKRTVTGQWLD